nr:hypothetical protein [Rickettsiales bacterium]
NKAIGLISDFINNETGGFAAKTQNPETETPIFTFTTIFKFNQKSHS